ncbi:MAG: hypothetical protein KF778_06705 [Rhodocyclaceae bacterium]|nr:hypothetical protein [Rhodocyclaceae bacterium]MBX3668077.1 hypothetical protein [Rhodocyclaceae bacterium]
MVHERENAVAQLAFVRMIYVTPCAPAQAGIKRAALFRPSITAISGHVNIT